MPPEASSAKHFACVPDTRTRSVTWNCWAGKSASPGCVPRQITEASSGGSVCLKDLRFLVAKRRFGCILHLIFIWVIQSGRLRNSISTGLTADAGVCLIRGDAGFLLIGG